MPSRFTRPGRCSPGTATSQRCWPAPGIALADVTAVWQRMLRHNFDLDLTGNGLIQPADIGHRLYA